MSRSTGNIDSLTLEQLSGCEFDPTKAFEQDPYFNGDAFRFAEVIGSSKKVDVKVVNQDENGNPIERGALSDEQAFALGIPPINPFVKTMYAQLGFEKVPAEAEKAKELGYKFNNGDASSAAILGVDPATGEVTATLVPQKYLYRPATAALIAELRLPKESAWTLGTNMANVSLLVPAYDESGKRIFIGQIKGRGISNEGRLSLPIIAGGIDARNLNSDTPLLDSISIEKVEELGGGEVFQHIRPQPESSILLTAEPDYGSVNFSMTSRPQNLDELRGAFTPTREVSKLAIVRLDNLYQIAQLQTRQDTIEIETILAGGDTTIESVSVNQHTRALAEYLSSLAETEEIPH